MPQLTNSLHPLLDVEAGWRWERKWAALHGPLTTTLYPWAGASAFSKRPMQWQLHPPFACQALEILGKRCSTLHIQMAGVWQDTWRYLTWQLYYLCFLLYWELFLNLLHKLVLSTGASCKLKCLWFPQSGDYEYIDVIMHGDTTGAERLIVDIDFRSHFEIARAVDSYGTLLNSLPVVYVGTLPRLKQFLHVMVDAAKWSLKQNSMPLPPWRSLPYLQAKWQSKYERKDLITEEGFHSTLSDHTLCIGHLKRLKTSLQSELETGGGPLMMPIKADKKRMPKSFERRRRRSLLSCWYIYTVVLLGHRRILRRRSNSLLLAIFVFPEKGETKTLFACFRVYR